MFYVLLYVNVHFSIAIILFGKRELIALLNLSMVSRDGWAAESFAKCDCADFINVGLAINLVQTKDEKFQKLGQ